MHSRSDPRVVVERFIHEVLAGRGPASPEDLVSNEVLLQKVRGFGRSFGDVSITVHVVAAAADHVGVHFTARGAHRGSFQGVQPTGRSWTAGCTALYRVQGGRIVDFWQTWDSLGILEQIGAVRRVVEASA